MDWLDSVTLQIPQKLASYVSIVFDEMFVKEGLFFDKHTRMLVEYADLGEVKIIFSWIMNSIIMIQEEIHILWPNVCWFLWLGDSLLAWSTHMYNFQQLVLKELIFSHW